MPRRRPTTPSVESLESKALMSAPAASIPTVAAMVRAGSRQVALNGSLRGTYSALNAIRLVGTRFDLSGSGRVLPHVRLKASGFLQSSQPQVDMGRGGGTIVLSGRGGSITLQLTGRMPGNFSDVPDLFDYTVTGGTRRYAQFSDRGTAILSAGPLRLPRGADPLARPVGNFRLTLTSGVGSGS